MNGQKLAIGLIIIFLFAACLLQTTMIGCSKSTSTDEAVSEEVTDDGPTFFSRLGDGSEQAAVEWSPVSENVMNQVAEMFENGPVVIASIDRGQPGSRAVRCLLEPGDGLSVQKQLYDAMYVLHQTYPEMNLYSVGLSEGSDETMETDWDTLDRFVAEGGYSFNTSAGEADNLWDRAQPGFVPEEPAEAEVTHDGPVPAVRDR